MSTQNARTDVHGSIDCNSQDMETVQMFVDKRIVVQPCGASFTHSRSEGADTWVGLKNFRPTERSHTSYDSIYMKCP